MATKPRGRRGKRVAKSKIAKPNKVSIAPSSRPTTAARMAAVWDQGPYGAGPYGGKSEALEDVGGQAEAGLSLNAASPSAGTAFQTDAFKTGFTPSASRN